MDYSSLELIASALAQVQEMGRHQLQDIANALPPTQYHSGSELAASLDPVAVYFCNCVVARNGSIPGTIMGCN